MIQEMLKAFMLIFIAEMGDKTQILAMAFATRFPVKKVLLGIFFGSLFNHGLAVVLGRFIQNFIPVNTIQVVAGFAFVGFSLWTLHSEGEDDDNENQGAKFGPTLTVALAFFIGELGDKTQLTAITLATDAMYPLFILAGTVLGMIFTGGIGIIIGKQLGDKIPEFTIKIIAASVFMFFGVSKLYKNLPTEYLTLNNIYLFVGIIVILIALILTPMIIRKRKGEKSLYIQKSIELYNYYRKVGKSVDTICLGSGTCGKCKGNSCIIGYTKTLIKSGIEEKDIDSYGTLKLNKETLSKNYNKHQVLDSLIMTVELIIKNDYKYDNENINEIRKNFETILFGKSIENIVKWDEYLKYLKSIAKTNDNTKDPKYKI